MAKKDYDLADSLEDFAASIVLLYEKMPTFYSAQYLAQQPIRSSCSTSLNYGEALGAGTVRDQINNLRITLKELRECLRNLNIQQKAKLIDNEKLNSLRNENDQLIRIIVTIIKNKS